MDIIDSKFYEKFEKINHDYDEILFLLESVEVMSDNKLFAHYLKQKKQIESLALLFKKYLSIENEIGVNNEIFELEKDEIVKNNIICENEKLKAEQVKVFENLKCEYLKTEQTNQTARIEITPKNSDAEFVDEFVCMVKNIFAETNAQVEVVSGKTTLITAKGSGVFDKVSFLSGVLKQIKQGKENLFQVIVLNVKETHFEIDEKDVLVEISKSSGAGGQHINKTESAVKLTHIPTGITAECQDERSQTKNKIRAFENLKQKILQKMQENEQKNIKNQRDGQKNAIFSSTPVLVFDYDKNKVSDSRTKKSYSLKEVLSGNTKIIESDLRI